MYFDEKKTINMTLAMAYTVREDTNDFVTHRVSQNLCAYDFTWGLVIAIDFASSLLTACLHAVYVSRMLIHPKSHWTQKRCLEVTCTKNLT